MNWERLTEIFIVIVVVAVGVYFAYTQMARWHESKLDTAVDQEKKEWAQKVGELKREVVRLQEELDEQRDAIVPKEMLDEVFGEEAPLGPQEEEEITCEELERQLLAFFAYLDAQPYVQSYALEEGTAGLFTQMVRALAEAPPVVTGEMMDLSSLLNNVAHFYRVLGKKPVKLVTEIMAREPQILEPVMANLFAWLSACDRCEEIITECVSPEVLYQYAGFFLNTLGGKGYLLRRDSKIRILTTYYAVLLLDKANDETLNQDGIDIRPHIDFAFYDITSQRGLIYQRKYLGKLQDLRDKYHMK
jgi:hypothetical protein